MHLSPFLFHLPTMAFFARFITGMLLLALALVVTIIATSFLQTHREYRAFREREQQAQMKLEEMRSERDRKEEYLRLMLGDKEFLERVLRERLGYVRAEETVFRFEQR